MDGWVGVWASGLERYVTSGLNLVLRRERGGMERETERGVDFVLGRGGGGVSVHGRNDAV